MAIKNLSEHAWTVHLISGVTKPCCRGLAWQFGSIEAFDVPHGRAFIEPVVDEL